MTSKQKVQKIKPEAVCWCYYNEDTGKTNHWICEGSDSSKMLSNSQSRESWAWGEAFRFLKSKNEINPTFPEPPTK